MDKRSGSRPKPKAGKNKKDAGNNQWTNKNAELSPDTRERRDGPGGENAK